MESRDNIDPNQLALNYQKITPDEITQAKFDGQNFEINTTEILSLLKNTIEKHFKDIDYSLINSPKSLLSHFYVNEKECIKKIDTNSYTKKKFYKILIYDSIEEIFNQGPKDLTKEIIEGLSKIRNDLYKKEKNKEEITLEYFNNLLLKFLGTKEVPKFLIRNDIKFIKFRANYNKKEKQRQEYQLIINYYIQIQKGQLKPFDYIPNKSQIFDIFVISNSSDIKNNELIREIFLENYEEILSWFNLDKNFKGYDYVSKNYINISSMEKKELLENLFIPIAIELNSPSNNKEDSFLILISSLFFCVLNKLKEPQKNNEIKENDIKENDIKDNISININNSRINKFFSNIISNIITYVQNCKYDIKNLVNTLYTFIIQENKIKESNITMSIIMDNMNSQKENIDYDFKLIEEIIMNSDDNNLKERFKSIKDKLRMDVPNLSPTIIGTLIQRVVEALGQNYYYYTNFLRLSPFQKFISSNTVTILISGFGSENDIHSIEWRKYIENAPYNTNYYFYHWPGDTFAKIIIKSLPIGITGIKFDSDLPKVFKESKDKAVICGKMLALILKSNLFFEHRQINLVAFSLGNHVVKNCLKELSSYNDNKCIINNVTFIAGATTFKNKLNWYHRFKKVVAGRIINCYSKGDYILKFLYANCTGNKPIGNHEVIINDGDKGKNIFENYDFTDINLGHLSYRNNFNEVIKKINIEK